MSFEEAQKSTSTFQPVPVGGWNARDSLDNFPPTDAIRLDNLIPEYDTVRLRRGFMEHGTGMGSAAIETLVEYSGLTARRLIACTGGKIYNASAAGAATELDTGFTEDIWQTCMYNNVLIMVNGTDQPQQYNGTAVSDATYTGVTDNDLIDVITYRSRLYFIQKNTNSIWYGGTNSITGALTEFSVSDYLQLGGYLQFMCVYTLDGRNGSQSLLVLVTNMGEGLCYSGANPGDTTWTLERRFVIAPPLGRRAWVAIDSDVAILTQDGVESLQKILQTNTGLLTTKLTDKIRNAFNFAAGSYKAYNGWQAMVYRLGHLAIFNVPIAPGSVYHQYVLNILTGAWCRLIGQNGYSWATYDDNLYFGGVDGVVYRADFGTTDNGDLIEAYLKTGFNYFNDRVNQKQFQLARPIITAEDAVDFDFGIDVDFEDQPLIATVTTEGGAGGEWDDAEWDVDYWSGKQIITSDWYSVSGVGRCAAIKLTGFFKNLTFKLNTIHIQYTRGGSF